MILNRIVSNHRNSNRPSTLALGRRILQARLGAGGPMYLIHSLTNRCNAQCRFCAWRFYDTSNELTTDEIMALHRDAREAGFVALSLWGGEPLIHRDIGEICRHAWELGFRTHIVTNGALLMKKMDQVLPYMDRFCFSVDHPSEKHGEMRAIPGLYGKIKEAVQEIKRREPKKQILFVYTFQQGNTSPDTLQKMAEEMHSMGVVGVFNAMRLEAATEDSSKSTNLEKFKASPEELSRAFTKVRELKMKGFPVLNSFSHLEMMRQGPPRYRCHWPKFIVPIEANGDVVDCMHWGKRPVGNLRQTPFSQLMKHPRLKALAGAEGEACHKCVSIHRYEISEACEGRIEPLMAWVMGLTF